MLSFRSCLAVPVAAVLLALATAPLAQPPAAAGSPSRTDGVRSQSTAARDPGDARAAVPAVTYSSAFARYRSSTEPELGNWRGSNDNVGRIGGWRIYGREASEPEGGKQANDSKPAAPVAGPRPEHGHKH
jgi:hypothetical protein